MAQFRKLERREVAIAFLKTHLALGSDIIAWVIDKGNPSYSVVKLESPAPGQYRLLQGLDGPPFMLCVSQATGFRYDTKRGGLGIGNCTGDPRVAIVSKLAVALHGDEKALRVVNR